MSRFIDMLSSFVLVFLVSFQMLSAQELPPIDNFTPVDYGAENQNWGISQSKQKNIYAANNSGLLEYNGAIWKLYDSPNGSIIRSVKAVDDRVYTGCYMEFGFWKKNAIGYLVYNSISNELKIPLLEDEEFWNILELDNWVLFQSLERIYIYNTLDKSVRIVDSKSTKAHMFDFQGTIYFHSTDNGLFKIENGKSVLVSDDPILKDAMVLGIFTIENKQVVLTEKGNFFFLDADDLVQWKTPFKEEIEQINVYSSLQLKDGSIVLGTISNGIYHISKEGSILRKIDKEKGLNNNTVLSIFEDLEHNLWLALDNGISVINLNSPFKEYIDKNGKLGVVYASSVFKDYLYLGTNQGLFYKQIGLDSDFEFIEGSQGQVWVLKIIDEVLFCGHNNGTYVIEEDRAELISDFPGTWDIKTIPNQKNLLLQGNFNGLSVLSKSENSWELRNVIEGFDISSRFFEFIGENQIAVNREFKGIFKLKINDSYTEVIAVENEASKGIGASLLSYDNDVLYTCVKGVYRYRGAQNKFTLDPLLTDAFYGDTDKPLGIFIADKRAKRLWCFTENNIIYASPGKFNTSSKINRISIPSYVRKNLGVLGFESVTPIGNEKYLIGISNGYLTVDLKKLDSKAYAVEINSIASESMNAEIKYIPNDGDSTFEYSKNKLFFSYNVPEFDKYTEVKYQYQLDGIYNNWSEWLGVSDASFENLPFGNYTFKVRAKIGNALSVNVASHRFRIERPWYLSNFTIVIYFLALVLVALLIHKLYKSYYRKQSKKLLRDNKKKLKRKKLKAQKKLVQISNEKLKEEVARIGSWQSLP